MADASPDAPPPNAPTGAATTTTDDLGGSYEVIRRRLLTTAEALAQKAEQLNAKRKEVFGGSELALLVLHGDEHRALPGLLRHKGLLGVLLVREQRALGLLVGDALGLVLLPRLRDGDLLVLARLGLRALLLEAEDRLVAGQVLRPGLHALLLA